MCMRKFCTQHVFLARNEMSCFIVRDNGSTKAKKVSKLRGAYSKYSYSDKNAFYYPIAYYHKMWVKTNRGLFFDSFATPIYFHSPVSKVCHFFGDFKVDSTAG